MKRSGPPFGSGWDAEGKAPVASPLSASISRPPPQTAAAPKRLEITLKSDRQGRFSAEFGGTVIVSATTEPVCVAAGALHELGHPDDAVLVARHSGADHEALRGLLGVWRQLRVREDRAGPRFVRWEPFPSGRVTPMARGTGEPRAQIAAAPSNEPGARPGAAALIASASSQPGNVSGPSAYMSTPNPANGFGAPRPRTVASDADEKGLAVGRQEAADG